MHDGWPALADCSSEAAVQARRDGPSLSSAPGYKISRRLLCQLIPLQTEDMYRIVLVLVLRKSIHFWRRCARKTMFNFSFPVTLSFDV